MPKILASGAAPSAPPDAPDQDALLERATQYTLPSGRVIWWLAPDEMELLAFTGLLPDPLTAAVYLLLRDEEAIEEPPDDPRSYQRELQRLKAEYQILKHGMVKPRFDPDQAIGNDEVWGRRDLPRVDRRYIYDWLFRLGTTPAAVGVPYPDESGRAAGPAPDREGVQPDTRTAVGDSDPGAGLLRQSGGADGRAAPAAEA